MQAMYFSFPPLAHHLLSVGCCRPSKCMAIPSMSKGPPRLTRIYRFFCTRVVYTYLVLDYGRLGKFAATTW